MAEAAPAEAEGPEAEGRPAEAVSISCFANLNNTNITNQSNNY